MSPRGFTLAELLIALGILGVVATFTIPKVLNAQQDSQWNSIAKETAGTLSGAYAAYRRQNVDVTGMTLEDLAPYLNYVKRETILSVDSYQEDPIISFDCSDAAKYCYKLHNGAILYTNGFSSYFRGMASNDAIVFFLDPDGRVTDGTADGEGKAVTFWLYTNGRITTYAGITSGTDAGTTTGYTPDASYDPPWFSW